MREITHLHPMQRLRINGSILPLSHTLYFRIQSSGTRRLVVGFPAFRRTWCLSLQESGSSEERLLTFKDEGITVLLTVRNHSHNNPASHPWRHEPPNKCSYEKLRSRKCTLIYFTLHYFTVFMDIALLPTSCRVQAVITFQRIVSRPT